MVSKALVVGAYQRKLEELAAIPGVQLTCIVPPYWQEQGRRISLEREHLVGYELVVEPIRFNGNFHLFYWPSLGRHMRRLRPDIVHIDEEPYNLATFLAMRLALAVGARPLFFTWQNLYRSYPPPFRWMERYTLARAAYAIAGNAEAVDVLRKKGYRGPAEVVPQFGVDPEVFRPAEPARNDGPLVVGYAGRLVPEKGVLLLLRALAGLPGSWRLHIIGNGPLAPEVLATAGDLHLRDRLVLESAVPSTRMADRFRSFDVLVLPSLSRSNWKEQFGRVLIEAMACGVPVVGSNCGEIGNVVGDAGLIFPEGDVEALREHLALLLGDAELRRELGRRGRQRVLERFTHREIARRTYEVYRRIMEEGTF